MDGQNWKSEFEKHELILLDSGFIITLVTIF